MGEDRRIQHAIALSMAAIEMGMKDRRYGCGILDNDYRATFNLMVAMQMREKNFKEFFFRSCQYYGKWQLITAES